MGVGGAARLVTLYKEADVNRRELQLQMAASLAKPGSAPEPQGQNKEHVGEHPLEHEGNDYPT